MKSFEVIYEEYVQAVFRFLVSLTRSEDLADELTQETFFRAFQHIDKFEGRCSLYTWLCQIAKTEWYKECNRNKRYQELKLEDFSDIECHSNMEHQVVVKDEWRRVRKVILELEEPYRDVFVLHIFGEIKLIEIAALYKKSESWARVTFFRAKSKIMQEVSK